MNDWFDWNGVRCTTYGIHVLEQPPITVPVERAVYTNVPGRPGSLTILEGRDVYDDRVMTVQCFISDMNQIANIGNWLKGSGTVTFANRQGGFYYARIANQISFEKVLRGREACVFAVNFRCKPFWYAENVADITLMVGTTIVELDGVDGSITLDTPIMEAYKGTTSQNSAMSGEFPLLFPGMNSISWTGNVSSVVIRPNWRYL